MGAINNLPYVIVNSASNTIAASFDEKNLVGLVFGANVALAVFVKALNTFVLLSVPFSLRYMVNGLLMLLGLFGVAYAFNFGFALACIVVVGATAAFGENVTLGMLSRYPSHMVNAWSSGTGMAGLLGSSIYIIFGCTVGQGSNKTEKLHHLTKYAFLLTTPVVLVYWGAFFLLLRPPAPQALSATQEVEGTGTPQPGTPQPGTPQTGTPQTGTPKAGKRTSNPLARRSSSSVGSQETQPLLASGGGGQGQGGGGGEGGAFSSSPSSSSSSPFVRHNSVNAEEGEEKQSQSPSTPHGPETTWRRLRRCTALVLYLAVNLCAVYVFEYVARGCAAKVRPDNEYHVGCPELYAALQFCYQAGVFVSRSSVQMFKIRSVGVMSVLQLLNMLLWILDAKFKVIPVYLLPALMIYVGLLGGASYVNIFYMLLHDHLYPAPDRELCINITAMFITLGIVLGTGVETVFFTTLLKND